MFVDGLVVMIVGAGPGLGATLARRGADDGADLVLAARTTGTLEQIAADVRARGQRVLARATDVSDRDQVRALADAALEEFGRVDVLVNAAFPTRARRPRGRHGRRRDGRLAPQRGRGERTARC